MLISIIMPIFNSEKRLAISIESILNQTYKDIELILVNDGSVDGSKEICSSYKNSDSRIITIDQSNKGVSAARNAGINASKGEYIGFVDSDDYLDTHSVEKIVDLIKNSKAEIIVSGFVKESSIGKVYFQTIGKDIVMLNAQQALYKVLNNVDFQGYVCNKFFSRKIINSQKKIRFNEEIHVCEDLLFTCECFLKSKKIIYNPEPLYHYVFHENNSTGKFNEKKLTALVAYENLFVLLKNQDQKILKRFNNTYMKINISFLMQYFKSSNTNKDIYRHLKKNLYRFEYHEITELKTIVYCIVAKLNPKILYSFYKKR